MAHPEVITEAWEALATTHTTQASEAARNLAAALEHLGLQVTVLDGVIYADDVTGPDTDGQYDVRASFKIEQVA